MSIYYTNSIFDNVHFPTYNKINQEKKPFFLFAVSQQDNGTGHGTYVEYVDSGIYATSAQGQSQM